MADEAVHGYPTHALKWSDGLAKSCADHVLDVGMCGTTGHDGRDISFFADRAKRYVNYLGTGENLAYARYDDTSGVRVIEQFIVDDGVPSRGHRSNIYNKGWTHTGIACGCHSVYGDICCI